MKVSSSLLKPELKDDIIKKELLKEIKPMVDTSWSQDAYHELEVPHILILIRKLCTAILVISWFNYLEDANILLSSFVNFDSIWVFGNPLLPQSLDRRIHGLEVEIGRTTNSFLRSRLQADLDKLKQSKNEFLKKWDGGVWEKK